MRVLLWILDRCEGKVAANDSEIGFLPNMEDIDVTDLDLSEDVLKALLAVDKEMWMEDAKDQEEYFAQFGDRLPAEIKKQLEILKANLSK
jgi:phosphoenolpyruvate carboxykinase (GTP)